MTTYMNAIKRTVGNWISENKTLAYTIIGAILLPLGLAIIGGLFIFLVWLGSFLFGTAMTILILFFALLGAIIGWMVANTREKEHADYY